MLRGSSNLRRHFLTRRSPTRASPLDLYSGSSTCRPRARIEFGLGIYLARAGDWAPHVLADLGDRSLGRQGHGCRVDVSFVKAVASIDPQQLVLAHEVSERHWASRFGHCYSMRLELATTTNSPRHALKYPCRTAYPVLGDALSHKNAERLRNILQRMAPDLRALRGRLLDGDAIAHRPVRVRFAWAPSPPLATALMSPHRLGRDGQLWWPPTARTGLTNHAILRAMDVATLYTIVTLASGQHRTEAHGFPSVAFCEAAAKKQREREPLSSKTQIYCVKHESVAEPRHRPRPRITTTAGNFPF